MAVISAAQATNANLQKLIGKRTAILNEIKQKHDILDD
jgi:hypothetical protein